jgi:hypothetical protein
VSGRIGLGLLSFLSFDVVDSDRSCKKLFSIKYKFLLTKKVLCTFSIPFYGLRRRYGNKNLFVLMHEFKGGTKHRGI